MCHRIHPPRTASQVSGGDWIDQPAIALLMGTLVERLIAITGRDLESTAVQTDAWHHRSDALTSAAAFIGISVALIGGKG
jgi:divalent metal cation (Fe/Co/Zn/Cd) transporter